MALLLAVGISTKLDHGNANADLPITNLLMFCPNETLNAWKQSLECYG